MKKIITRLITGLFVALAAATQASAGGPLYAVTITNLTQAQKITPILVASSKKSVKLFKLGDPAAPELADIAEGGDISGMKALLMANPEVVDVSDSGGLLEPGDSVTVMVSAKGAKYISLAAMLIPTNDAFIALNGVKIMGREIDFQVPAYDAGSETNDEDCANIPGPDCGGAPFSPMDDGEGHIYVHGGIHGIGDLDPEFFDWRNPVAHVQVVRGK